ncbi:zinc dependent phospholipase C family protein [Desulfovibrio aminophilus]|uniref:zinc dependent phospholipase C family protein n=1 Tax=Desulfovibrio aminophilus TaxID=81425 RepID=UPI0033981620
MPGAYAHLTMVNEVGTRRNLERLPGFTPQAAAIAAGRIEFLELGAVSPDYPYLDLTSEKSKRWADIMHYEDVGGRIRAGIDFLRPRAANPDTSFRTDFPWFLGFVAHVTTDLSIHPVVELKVGPYAQNADRHRLCEMHQDAFIFRRMLNLGEIRNTEFIDYGLRQCDDPRGSGRLSPDVIAIWDTMLRGSGKEYAANPPDFQKWHDRFLLLVDDVAEEASRIPFLGRHIAEAGFSYPQASDIDRQYIDDLEVPGGERWNYQRVFEEAEKNVEEAWSKAALAIFEGDGDARAYFQDVNLDTGRVLVEGPLVYWRTA